MGEKKILVVDDESTIVSLLMLAFRELGYVVTPAYDGEQALLAFEADDFDGAIVDLNLPRLNGRQVCRAIKARCSIPVIVITGQAVSDSMVRTLVPEADAHFLKPFDIMALLDVMEQLIERDTPLLEREV